MSDPKEALGRLKAFAYWLRPYDQGKETANPYEHHPDQASIDLFVSIAEREGLEREVDRLSLTVSSDETARDIINRAAALLQSDRDRAAAAEAKLSALKEAVRGLWAEYMNDEECDYVKINCLIEAAYALLHPTVPVEPS